MLTRIKNIILCALYLLTFTTIYLGTDKKCAYYTSFVLFTFLYYAALLHSKVHMRYVFLLSERTTPWWTYAHKIAFHILLYLNDRTSIATATATWGLIILWKEIRFLVKHAEKRIGKIDYELYKAQKGIRIAHVRRNMLQEDMENRFHLNLHDTNRLYILPLTPDTERDYCAIHNYKQERREGKSPKLYDAWEQRMWMASADETVFISNRSDTVLYPLVFILIFIIWTFEINSPQAYTNTGLFILEILTTVLGSPRVNDTVIDVVYYITSTIFVTLYANAPCN